MGWICKFLEKWTCLDYLAQFDTIDFMQDLGEKG